MFDDDQLQLHAIPLLTSEAGKEIVREICQKHEFPVGNLLALVEAKALHVRTPRRRRLFDKLDEIFEGADVD